MPLNLPTQPINYMAMMQQPDTSKDIMEGMQLAAAIQAMREKREKAEQAKLKQEQFKNDFSQAWESKKPGSFIELIGKHPDFGQQFKQAYDVLSDDQKKNELSIALQINSALQSGNPEVAKELLTNLKAAAANSGGDVEAYDFLMKALDKDPTLALNYSSAHLAAIAPKEFGDALSKMGSEKRANELQPYEVQSKKAGALKSEAEAKTAGVKAKYAESEALLDLEKKGWDIKGIKSDIEYKKASSKIQAMQVDVARKSNDLQRQTLELKIEETKRERDEKVRTKAADVTAARDNMDNFLGTAQRLLDNPDLNDAVGPIEGRLPAMSDKTSDVVSLIDTLKSQAFMASIPNMKGMGQLSDAEGKKIETSLQNLGRVQSEKQLIANVKEAQRLIKKARTNLSRRYGVPDTSPDVPANKSETQTATGATVSNW